MDLDLLREIARRNVLSVHVTVTTVDEKLARLLSCRPADLALTAGAAHAADTKDLVLNGDAKCTKCHDENDNKKLDTNLIGIPKEGFGYSKDAMGRFGPPKFDDAVLTVPWATVAPRPAI